MNKMPRHVAIIMDGNRRWARNKRLPNIVGHQRGAKSIENVLKAARDNGVKVLTLYAFSTENWKRSKIEVDTLMRLLGYYLDTQRARLVGNNIKLTTIGDIDKFMPDLRRKLKEVIELTKANSGLTLNLALNYGGRDEIVEASRRIAEDAKRGKINASDISEALFSKYLYTSSLPDPDLLIRTGGEFRVSNFLLWQISYSELYVTDKLWPDFGKKDFEKALTVYAQRDRRIGG